MEARRANYSLQDESRIAKEREESWKGPAEQSRETTNDSGKRKGGTRPPRLLPSLRIILPRGSVVLVRGRRPASEFEMRVLMRGCSRMLWSRTRCPDPRKALGNTHLSRPLIKDFLLRNQLVDVIPTRQSGRNVRSWCGCYVGGQRVWVD